MRRILWSIASKRPSSLALFLVAQFLLLGCEVGGYPAESPAGQEDPTGSDPAPQCESYPLGAPRDPSTLPACCGDLGGDAHCVPDEDIPAQFEDLVDACEGGGSCVPDPFIETGGVHVPEDCVSVGQADGVCLSVCVPQVAENLDLLPQDICDQGQRCVPCVNPLDGTETGACALRENSCDADLGGDDGGMEPPEVSCPYEGPPLIDPADMPACDAAPDTCSDASCVPGDLVPDSFESRLAACDDGSLCVPNEFVRTAGNTVPETCESVAGFEGRCLSRCLPEVAEQADLLPQSTCADTHLCAPCYDPFTGAPTGACELSCDPGPKLPTEELSSCCNIQGEDIGSCIPPELAGDQAEMLDEDVCAEKAGEGYLCVPDEIANETFVAEPCTTEGFFTGGEPGACLPECLGAVDSAFIGQGDCPADYKCAPCETLLTGETGACDYLPGGAP